MGEAIEIFDVALVFDAQRLVCVCVCPFFFFFFLSFLAGVVPRGDWMREREYRKAQS